MHNGIVRSITDNDDRYDDDHVSSTDTLSNSVHDVFH